MSLASDVKIIFHLHDSLEPQLENMQGKRLFCNTSMMAVFSWIWFMKLWTVNQIAVFTERVDMYIC